MRPSSSVLLFMSLSSCTGVTDAPAAPPPVSPPEPETTTPTPDAPALPIAARPVAATPVAATPVAGPPHLAVAFEGRCGGLAASVLDDQVFVHHVSELLLPPGSDRIYAPHVLLARLDASGQPTETIPEPPPNAVDPQTELSGLFGLAGRWPDQVYAAVSIGTRGDYDTGYIRFDGKTWAGVHPFDPLDQVSGILPWHDRSIVAIACNGECKVDKLPVIRGAPKGPRTDKLSAAMPSCERITLVDIAAAPTGDLVALARCNYTPDLGLYAARWRPDDLAGEIKRLAPPGSSGGLARIAHNDQQDFWIALEAAKLLIHSTPGRWDPVEAPPGKGLADLAVDPRGALWFLRPDGLWRRDGDKWLAEDVQVEAMRDLLGVEQDTPWVLGTTFARRSADGSWQRAELPTSAFFPERRLTVQTVEVDRAGDLWIDADFTVIRKDKNAVGRNYHSVVTSRPVLRPLRCGEVLLEALPTMFAPWPTGADATCQHPLVLLQRQKRWKPGNTYPAYAKAMRKATDIGAPRFVELEIGGTLALGAIVDSLPAAKALAARARKAQRWQFPETVCGDPAALARADGKIVRELALDLAAGTLSESSPAINPG